MATGRRHALCPQLVCANTFTVQILAAFASLRTTRLVCVKPLIGVLLANGEGVQTTDQGPLLTPVERVPYDNWQSYRC
jgi:hypothetical protein